MPSDQIVRYALDGATHYGVMSDDATIARLAGSPFDGLHRSGERDLSSHARLLAPVEQPRIFGLGKNLMIHSILQFALHIAFRCVLHRYENQDIHR